MKKHILVALLPLFFNTIVFNADENNELAMPIHQWPQQVVGQGPQAAPPALYQYNAFPPHPQSSAPGGVTINLQGPTANASTGSVSMQGGNTHGGDQRQTATGGRATGKGNALTTGSAMQSIAPNNALILQTINMLENDITTNLDQALKLLRANALLSTQACEEALTHLAKMRGILTAEKKGEESSFGGYTRLLIPYLGYSLLGYEESARLKAINENLKRINNIEALIRDERWQSKFRNTYLGNKWLWRGAALGGTALLLAAAYKNRHEILHRVPGSEMIAQGATSLGSSIYDMIPDSSWFTKGNTDLSNINLDAALYIPGGVLPKALPPYNSATAASAVTSAATAGKESWLSQYARGVWTSNSALFRGAKETVEGTAGFFANGAKYAAEHPEIIKT